jgi:hypothetical protein
MTARRSFEHAMKKFKPLAVVKPVAIITAWRGVLDNPLTGQPFPEPDRQRLNDEANELLIANIGRRGLSFYLVVGAGQELVNGIVKPNKENSFVVQPIGEMAEDVFESHIRELLFNPTDQAGQGPFQHTQWGALVK